MSEMSSTPSSTYLDFNALARLKGEAAQDPSKAIRQTSEQFEAYFIQQMMKTMRESIEKSDLLEGGNMEMYQDLMDKEVSLQLVKRGGMGLADMMEKQMRREHETNTLAISTQTALQQRNPDLKAMPLNPVREGMPVKAEAIKAYELERNTPYKLDQPARGAKP